MMDLSLLMPNQISGRVPRPNKQEIELLIQQFKARGITYYRIAKALGVSATSARRWYEGKVSATRLLQLLELLAAVQDWERRNNRRWGT